MIRFRLLFTLACVAAAAIWFAPSSKEVVEPAVRTSQPRSSEAPAVLAVIPKLAEKPAGFERAAALLLPGEQPQKTGPSTVNVPQVPEGLAVIGKLKADTVWKAIVSYGGKTYIVGQGDQFHDRFLVERLDPPDLVLIDLEQGKHAFAFSVGAVP